MSITNAARRFEQRFDAKAECVCLYQYDRYRLSYGMAFGLVVIFISSLNAQKITNAIFRGKVL